MDETLRRGRDARDGRGVVVVAGATGYLGGYVCTRLLDRDPDVHLHLLIRGRDRAHAIDKLWRGWQLHVTAEAFAQALARTTVHLGDLHATDLGLDRPTWSRLAKDTDSVLHIAASLNRKSERACLNTNLRGALSV